MASEKKRDSVTVRDIAKYTLVILAILATATFFWIIRDAFLIAFAGVIFAVVINGLSAILRRFLPISRSWSIASVGVIILILFGAFGFIFGSQITKEFYELTDKLPEKISELHQTIREWPMGEEMLDGEKNGNENGEGDAEENGQEENDNGENSLADDVPDGTGGVMIQIGFTIVDILATILIILFIGIYFVINPELYKQGVALLFTKKRSGRVIEALETAGSALWDWLSGQFIAMIFVGVMVTIGLMVIGVPLAMVLGLIAGLAEFVPIVGPWAGAVPGILLAFSGGSTMVLYTALLYLVVQQIESNVLTPLIQQRMVHIPPAVVIISVVAFGLAFGIAGVILATPLAVVAMVLVGMFYVQDVLGKEVKIPGQKKSKKKK